MESKNFQRYMSLLLEINTGIQVNNESEWNDGIKFVTDAIQKIMSEPSIVRVTKKGEQVKSLVGNMATHDVFSMENPYFKYIQVQNGYVLITKLVITVGYNIQMRFNDKFMLDSIISKHIPGSTMKILYDDKKRNTDCYKWLKI